jgi:hypothetical protein
MCSTERSSAATCSATAIRSSFAFSMPSKRMSPPAKSSMPSSTSQEAEVGVKWKAQRGWRVSHWQRRRGILCQAHQTPPQTRCLSLSRRFAGSHQSLHRGDQRQFQTIAAHCCRLALTRTGPSRISRGTFSDSAIRETCLPMLPKAPAFARTLEHKKRRRNP